VLVTFFLPVYPNTDLLLLPYTTARLRYGLLAWLYELGPQPSHLHHLQQGFPPRFSENLVPVMFVFGFLLALRQGEAFRRQRQTHKTQEKEEEGRYS
jgi:hypothetical protein